MKETSDTNGSTGMTVTRPWNGPPGPGPGGLTVGSEVHFLAQLGAAESLSVLCAGAAGTLFGSAPATVQASLRALSTRGGFARLARDFFARFVCRFLEYHLSRELSNHVGAARRFRGVDEHDEFLRQLHDHCQYASAVLRRPVVRQA